MVHKTENGEWTTATKEDYKKIWNEAIEAAAKKAKEYLNSKGYKGVKTFAAVMELKK